MATPVRRIDYHPMKQSSPYYLWTALMFAGEMRIKELAVLDELHAVARRENKVTLQQMETIAVKASRIKLILNANLPENLKTIAQKLFAYYSLTLKKFYLARSAHFTSKVEWLTLQDTAFFTEQVNALTTYQKNASLAEKIIITEQTKAAAAYPEDVATIADLALDTFNALIADQELIPLHETKQRDSKSETLLMNIINHELAQLVKQINVLSGIYINYSEKIAAGLEHEQKILKEFYNLRQQDNHTDRLEVIVGKLVDYFESRNLVRYQDKIYLMRNIEILQEAHTKLQELKEQLLPYMPKEKFFSADAISRKVILFTQKVLPRRKKQI